jgi:predicted PurR-regulated permease PerM
VGTIIALVPPTILALLDGGLVPAALVVVGFGLVNVAQDYLLQPRMMGTELNLSSLVVFLSVIAWAWILGAAGALLAVPLTVALVQLLDAFPSSRGIAALMRNRLDAPPGLVDESDVGADPGAGDAGAGDDDGAETGAGSEAGRGRA